MSLPNLLVIGAMRSGTTWLDALLRSHPEVYLPKRRKEIHFFDAYFHRGLDWYQSFFPSKADAGKYRWIGEVTPRYLYHPETPKRIRQYLPDCHFLAILRNPADRAYSHYGFSIRDNNEQRSFPEYLEHYPGVLSRGFYGKQVRRYFRYFPRERFLFLIFEKTFEDPRGSAERIASFLSLPPDPFQGNAGSRKNASYRPRFSALYAGSRSWARSLRTRDMDWAVRAAKRVGIKRAFGRRRPLPGLDEKLRTALLERYEPDIALLEDLIDEDLGRWRVQDVTKEGVGR